MFATLNHKRSFRHRGAVAFMVLILIPVLLGFAVLTIDIGVVYNTRADLQNAADAGALAATAVLANDRSAAGVEKARAAALSVIQQHVTLGHKLNLDPSELVFGRATRDALTNQITFTPTEVYPDAAQVYIKRSAGSVNGGTPLLFASIFGKTSTNVSAKATAALAGLRDIAVVIDLTYTMNYDSQLFHAVPHTAENGTALSGTQINLRDIWCSLDGPLPARPYLPGDESETEYAGDTGPTIGAMSVWGSPVVPNSYNPTTDPGLWYIAEGSTTNDTSIRNSLLSRAYSADEANQLMSGGEDGSGNQWQNRTAAITGLAQWRSGRTGGTPGGDGDNRVEDNELTWIPLPSYAGDWTWSDFISYPASTGSKMYSGDSRLQYCYGVKTFTNFLLERPLYSQTDILWQTPAQPIQAVKDAVQTFVNVIIDSGNNDQVSLEIFDTAGRHQVDLTDGFQTVAERLYELQAAHWARSTNMGAGIATAIAELTSGRARDNARKVIILLSDGQPNTDENGEWSGFGSSVSSGYALSEAQRAADEGIRIFTVTVGWDANRALMQQIADIGNGREFQAAGAPEEYTQQLQDIFFQLGGERIATLVE